jgi:hypothetical protein
MAVAVWIKNHMLLTSLDVNRNEGLKRKRIVRGEAATRIAVFPLCDHEHNDHPYTIRSSMTQERHSKLQGGFPQYDETTTPSPL